MRTTIKPLGECHALRMADGNVATSFTMTRDDLKRLRTHISRYLNDGGGGPVAAIVDQNHGFEAFWKKYPRKIAKQKAAAAWRRLSLWKHTLKICLDVDRRITLPDWIKENGKYIPHPATYLNQRRWEDEDNGPTTNRDATKRWIDGIDAKAPSDG